MKLYDHVIIKKSGVTGIIVDIYNDNIIVESDKEREPEDPLDENAYGGRWPLYDVREDELECL